jgi:hypothetical protein
MQILLNGYLSVPLIAVLTTLSMQISATEETTNQDIVIHLSKSTDNLHAVNMALKLGALLTSEGANVTIVP